MGCGGCTPTEAYHAHFPSTILHNAHPICHLDVLNVVWAVQLWAPHLVHKLVHLYSDSSTAVAIFQAGRGRDNFIRASAREVWVDVCHLGLILVVGHIPDSCLADTADALSRWHLELVFRDKVSSLIISQ